MWRSDSSAQGSALARYQAALPFADVLENFWYAWGDDDNKPGEQL